MSHGLALLFIGGAQIVLGVQTGGFAWLLLWSGASFALVGAAYTARKPSVFGKRSDGSLPWPNVLLLLPFLFFTWGVWGLQTALTREPACHEIAPGLWIGRNPRWCGLPKNVRMVVDLAAEFGEPVHIRHGRTYICAPVLDGSTPGIEALCAVIERVNACAGPVYIHCALGHGRSGTLAAALLIARGHAKNAMEAEAMISTVRPGVRLHKGQRALLDLYVNRVLQDVQVNQNVGRN
jgi:protein-tyrosine phosphatase